MSIVAVQRKFKTKDGYKLRMTMRVLYEPHDELLFELKPITK